MTYLFLGAIMVSMLLNPHLQERGYAEEVSAIFEKGIASMQKGKMNSAATAFERVLKEDPEHVMAHFQLGSLFLLQGRLNQAQSHLQRAVALSPLMVLAALRLSEVYQRMGDLEKAIKTLDAISSKIEDKTDPQLQEVSKRIEGLQTIQTLRAKTREGIVLFRSGNSVEAEQRFREVFALQPQDPEIHRLLGMVSGEQGRNDEAIDHFKTSLDLKPDLNDSRKMLIELYALKGEFDLARAEIEMALLFSSDREGADGVLLEESLHKIEDQIQIKRLTTQWVEQDEKNQIDAAISTIQEIIKIDPNDLSAYLNLGNLLAKKEQYDLAETAFKKAIEIDPDYTNAHQRLGQVYEVSRLFGRAHAQYEKGLATPKGQVSPMKEILVESIRRNENIKLQAIPAAEEALAKAKDFLEAGNIEQGLIFTERAVFFYPENLRTRFQLARLYEQNGRTDFASRTLRLLVGSDPEFVEAQQHLASLDEKNGFFYQALKRWKAHGNDRVVLARLEKKVAEIEAATAPLMKQAEKEMTDDKPLDAIETLLKAQELAPDDPRIRLVLGRLYTKVGKKTEAYESLSAAGFFEPDDGQANYFLGQLYETGSQWRDAQTQYETALKSLKISPALRIKAEEGLNRAIENIKNIALADRIFNRARRRQAEADHLGAIAEFDRTLGLFPTHIWSLYWTGWSYEKLSDYKTARKYYLRALEISPSHSLSLQRLGFLNEIEGNVEDAIRYYRKNLEVWSGAENAETEWVKSRLAPLEKRFTVNINQVLLSYNSNPELSQTPSPDIHSSINIDFTYLLKKDTGLQIPIGISSGNFFFLKSDTIFSQETFHASAIRSSDPLVYSIGYNYRYGFAEGGATGSNHVGLLDFSWFSKESSSVAVAYSFNDFISEVNRDFDSTNQSVRLTYNKGWRNRGTAISYRFSDNDAKLLDQASKSNGLVLSYWWNPTSRFITELSYEVQQKDFVNFDSLHAFSTNENKRRQNVLQVATLSVSYRLQEGITLSARYSELNNDSNLAAAIPVTLEQQLSGQAASLGNYSQRVFSLNINWSF